WTGSDADRLSRDRPARPGAARHASLEATSSRAGRGPAPVSATPMSPASRPSRHRRPNRAADSSGSPVLGSALTWIAANAGDLDRHPRFPTEAFERLGAAGVLGA